MKKIGLTFSIVLLSVMGFGQSKADAGVRDAAKDLAGKAVDAVKGVTAQGLEMARLVKEHAPWNKIFSSLLKTSALPAARGCLVGSVSAVPAAVTASAAATPLSGIGVVAGACGVAALKAGAPGFAKTVYQGVADTVRLVNLDTEIKLNLADAQMLTKISSDYFKFTMENPGLDAATLAKTDKISADILKESADLQKYVQALKAAYEEIKKVPSSKK